MPQSQTDGQTPGSENPKNPKNKRIRGRFVIKTKV